MKAWITHVCAVLVIVAGWQVAQLPSTSSAEEEGLAQRFAFSRQPLNGAGLPRSIRTVAPAYKNIDHWISSVGAAVALADIDGNGRSDDSCVVDPRDDSVTVRPVPGTGQRFAEFRLTPVGVPYDRTMAPMGCVPGDYNEDGRSDVLVYYWGRSPLLFLRGGAGTGPADFVTRELVTPYQVWSTNAVTIADVDGDGHTDIVVGNYFPDRARVLDPNAHQRELRMQRSMSRAYNGGYNRVLLYRQGTGGAEPTARFDDVPGVFSDRVAKGWTLAAGAQDLDGDGRPEIYFGNDFGPDRLLWNHSTPGRPRFQVVEGVRHLTTPKSKVLGRDSFKGMGVGFADLNHDDVPDILVSNIAENFALLESHFAFLSTRRPPISPDGTAHYDDHSESLGLSRSGWGWDIKAGDFAGTGDTQIMQATGFIKGTTNRWPQLQELAMTNDDLLAHPEAWPKFRPGADISGSDPNPFFVRGQDGRFHDIAARIGVADPGVSRGIALSDVDHDGRLDFAVANQWRQSYFYRNTRTAQPPYLGLRLLRPAAGPAGGGACAGHPSPAAPVTPAVGSAVTIRAGAAGNRVGQVYPAGGHGGVSAPELLFALAGAPGTVPGPVPVSVTWRDGCGTRHSTDVRLAAGWHSLLLGADGSLQEVTS